MELLRPLLQRVAGLAACLCLFQSAAAQTTREYDLKAAFLFNFAQFVEWPPGVFASSNSPIVIGILGENPFGKTLEELIRNENIRGRPLEVKYFTESRQVQECHILFISSSEALRAGAILQSLKGKPIVTVAEIDQFIARGGVIRFVTDKNKIRFRINQKAAQEAGLLISSKLLRLAESVQTEDTR